jgi:hypothetical protein
VESCDKFDNVQVMSRENHRGTIIRMGEVRLFGEHTQYWIGCKGDVKCRRTMPLRNVPRYGNQWLSRVRRKRLTVHAIMMMK